MRLTGKQRYWQALTLARRKHNREFASFLAGGPPIDMCGMDRERNHLIRELDRAYEAGLAAGRAALAESVEKK